MRRRQTPIAFRASNHSDAALSSLEGESDDVIVLRTRVSELALAVAEERADALKHIAAAESAEADVEILEHRLGALQAEAEAARRDRGGRTLTLATATDADWSEDTAVPRAPRHEQLAALEAEAAVRMETLAAAAVVAEQERVSEARAAVRRQFDAQLSALRAAGDARLDALRSAALSPLEARADALVAEVARLEAENEELARESVALGAAGGEASAGACAQRSPAAREAAVANAAALKVKFAALDPLWPSGGVDGGADGSIAARFYASLVALLPASSAPLVEAHAEHLALLKSLGQLERGKRAVAAAADPGARSAAAAELRRAALLFESRFGATRSAPYLGALFPPKSGGPRAGESARVGDAMEGRDRYA